MQFPQYALIDTLFARICGAAMKNGAKKLAPYRETKRLKAHERRFLIIEAAQAILLSQGFAALSLRNAADAADIRMATLQYYFPTRDDLFEAIFQNIVDRIWQEILDNLNGERNGDPEARLRQWVNGICNLSDNNEVVEVFTELWAVARVHGFAADIMQRYYADAINLMTRLTRAVRPDQSAQESRQRSILALSMIEGFSLFRQLDIRAGRRACVAGNRVSDTVIELLTK